MSTLLGVELKRMRLDRELTLSDVAEGTGITIQYLSMLENGQRKSVSFEIMTNISKYYGVPLDYFTLFLEEDEDTKQLDDVEIMLWQAVNEKIKDDVFYKNGNTIKKIFPKLFK
ncbi:MAG: helix-turn-helix transcriptional regulator [Bacillaceae bacterium]|nr:helix-turn-helix transcriptional regulator [Bacillaceae bacterium]